MWQKKWSDLIKEEIEILLAPLSVENELYDLVKEPLLKVETGLTTTSNNAHFWPLLPLIVCEAISGHYNHAIPVAAAFQFLMAAGDVFDDIEDEDSFESLSTRCGRNVATNVATTLIILAEKAITRLKIRGVEDDMIIRLMDTVNSYYTIACIGQHLDLSLDSINNVTEDNYLKIINMKSASQIECVCYLGALLANTTQELVDIFTSFGNRLGMAAQIANDIQGVILKRDLLNQKETLPAIYALTHTIGETRDRFKQFFSKQSKTMLNTTQMKEQLFISGAIHYSTIKMEFYKQQALDILLEAERAGAKIERLKRFLE
jgi:geranylgeranyl diphosphate synthase type I